MKVRFDSVAQNGVEVVVECTVLEDDETTVIASHSTTYRETQDATTDKIKADAFEFARKYQRARDLQAELAAFAGQVVSVP